MSLGVLGGSTLGAALGVSLTIPGECWEQAGFKDCYSKMYSTAQLECRLQGKENDECIVPRVSQLSNQGCKCVKKPASSGGSAFVSPKPQEPVELEPSIMGFSMKSILITGLVAYGLYTYFGEDQKKGKG